MSRLLTLSSIALSACILSPGFFGLAVAAETITAQELENYFYADGKMTRSQGQFEITYYIDGDSVIRTRVYDVNKREVLPDNTIYKIVRGLASDPTNKPKPPFPPTIRAIGQPGADALEILTIGDTFIQSVKFTSDYFVISRQKRRK